MITSTPNQTPSKHRRIGLLQNVTNTLFKKRKLSNIVNQSVTAQVISID